MDNLLEMNVFDCLEVRSQTGTHLIRIFLTVVQTEIKETLIEYIVSNCG